MCQEYLVNVPKGTESFLLNTTVWFGKRFLGPTTDILSLKQSKNACKRYYNNYNFLHNIFIKYMRNTFVK